MNVNHKGKRRSCRFLIIRGDGWGRCAIRNQEDTSKFEFWIVRQDSITGTILTERQTTRDECTGFLADLVPTTPYCIG